MAARHDNLSAVQAPELFMPVMEPPPVVPAQSARHEFVHD
jgi:hypothetical protein